MYMYSEKEKQSFQGNVRVVRGVVLPKLPGPPVLNSPVNVLAPMIRTVVYCTLHYSLKSHLSHYL
jgi:hypothetical protein